MSRREIILLAIAVVAVLSLPVAYHQGQKSVAIDIASTVLGIEIPGRDRDTTLAPCDDALLVINHWYVWTDDNPYLEPTPGVQYLAFDVSLTNLSDTVLDINPFRCHLQDANAREYRTTLSGPRPCLPMKSIAPGHMIRGWVTYEVPTSAKAQSISYSIDLRGRQYVEAKI